jgi:3-hydroxyisobutyrate dehydrogenase
MAAGHEVVVCDVKEEAVKALTGKGATAADAAGVGSAAEVVVVAVVNDDQLRSVLLGPAGAIPAMSPGDAVVVVSTVSAGALAEVAGAASTAGVGVVDCGVSGGPAATADGTLVCMVGGAEDLIERVMPVLETFSSKVVRMGVLGAGMKAKLARNVAQYGSWAAAYEAQKLAEAAGVDLARLAEVIRASDAKTGGTSALMFRSTVAPFGPGDDPGLVEAMRAAAALARKDLSAALELAADLNVEMPLTASAETGIGAVFGSPSS